jgi:hypothetical protein
LLKSNIRSADQRRRILIQPIASFNRCRQAELLGA